MKEWKDYEVLDDTLQSEEKDIVEGLEKDATVRCPFLKKDGKFFLYCSKGLPENVKVETEPFNPVYRAHQESISAQLWCLSDNYENCSYFKGIQNNPGSDRK